MTFRVKMDIALKHAWHWYNSSNSYLKLMVAILECIIYFQLKIRILFCQCLKLRLALVFGLMLNAVEVLNTSEWGVRPSGRCPTVDGIEICVDMTNIVMYIASSISCAHRGVQTGGGAKGAICPVNGPAQVDKLPEQFKPSPSYPLSHEHSYDPGKFLQTAFSPQGDWSHSSMSKIQQFNIRVYM